MPVIMIGHVKLCQTIVIFIVLFVAVDTPSSAQNASDAHPAPPELGLLFSSEDLVTMRQNVKLPIFRDYWAEVLSADVADGNFMREAFIYQLTGDVARGESAKRLVLETAEMEHWNNFVDGDLPLGFLQDGRLTAWMSLAYDWLYDLLTEDERALVREAIAEKGCVPLYRALHGMRYPKTVKGWAFAPYTVIEEKVHIDMTRWPDILGHNNFRAIINGGLTLGLLVLDGYDSRVEDWKEMVIDSIERFSAMLEDDGSYEENVSYLNYAMTHEVYGMEAARRKLGVDFFDSANFEGMMQFVVAMYMPSYLFGNASLTFGDSGPSLSSATAFWVARNARDGLAQYAGLNYSDHDLLSLLYYDPTVRPEAPDDDSYFVETDLDWIISRSGHGLDDYVLGMRSGFPTNHEHGDRNSIQLKAYGEILLADHRRLTYWSNDPEWMMRSALGHNTVLIDGIGSHYHHGEEGTNKSKSYAKIVRAGRRAGYHFWASDATQAYQVMNPDVRSVTRSIISFPAAPAVIVMDKVMKATTPSRTSTRWHLENEYDGEAALEVNDGSFIIRRPHARLYAAVAGDSDQKLAPGQFDSANKEYPFTWVEATDADSLIDSFKLMVGIPLAPDEPNPTVGFEREGHDWTIRIRKNDSKLEMKVYDRGVLPEFEVTTMEYE